MLLASLMCLVLSIAQCFALKGGPNYTGTTANIVGTFAGVMRETNAPNTLGLFSVSIPRTGFANGSVVLFVAGRSFVGTISGIGDPNRASLSAVVQTTTETTIVLCTAAGTPATGTVSDRADGSLNADIRRTPRSAISVAGTLLTGSAFLRATRTEKDPADCTQTLENTTQLDLLVDGFKQSNT